MKRPTELAAGWSLAAVRGTLSLAIQAAVSGGLWWWISGAIGFVPAIRRVVLLLILGSVVVRWVMALVASGSMAVRMAHDETEDR